MRVGGDLLDPLEQLGPAVGGLRVDRLDAALGVIGDRRQRLVQFVRQPGGDFAHRADPRDVRQLGLLHSGSLLGAAALGNVHQRSHHPHGLAVGIDHDEPALEHVGIRAVAPAKAIFDGVLARLGGAGRDFVRTPARGRPDGFARSTNRDPYRPVGLVAEQRGKSLAAPHLAASHVPIPNRIARGLGRQPESLFAFAQLLFGKLRLRDVDDRSDHPHGTCRRDRRSRIHGRRPGHRFRPGASSGIPKTIAASRRRSARVSPPTRAPGPLDGCAARHHSIVPCRSSSGTPNAW